MEKTYYVMVHFDGSYVSGMIVPNAKDELHAISMLRKVLRVRLHRMIETKKDTLEINRIKAFIRSVKRPWRVTKEGDKVVVIQELQLPVFSDYWLEDILIGCNLCNQRYANFTVPSKYNNTRTTS